MTPVQRDSDHTAGTHLAACPCYPHPPLCVNCLRYLTVDRCTNMACAVYLDGNPLELPPGSAFRVRPWTDGDQA